MKFYCRMLEIFLVGGPGGSKGRWLLPHLSGEENGNFPIRVVYSELDSNFERQRHQVRDCLEEGKSDCQVPELGSEASCNLNFHFHLRKRWKSQFG